MTWAAYEALRGEKRAHEDVRAYTSVRTGEDARAYTIKGKRKVPRLAAKQRGSLGMTY